MDINQQILAELKELRQKVSSLEEAIANLPHKFYSEKYSYATRPNPCKEISLTAGPFSSTYKIGKDDLAILCPQDFSHDFLPDELFEDQLHQYVRNVSAVRRDSTDVIGKRLRDCFNYDTARAAFEKGGMELLRKIAPISFDVDSFVARYGSNWIAPIDPEIDPKEFQDEIPTDPMHDVSVDPPPTPIIDIRAERRREGLCPDCGAKGEWINMACVCPEHGRFMG